MNSDGVGTECALQALLDHKALINPESSNKSIDVIIGRLRSKIEENPKNPQYIISVRGVGYKLEA